MKILSIDQSYTHCGIAYVEDSEPLYFNNFVYKKSDTTYKPSKQEKRRQLIQKLGELSLDMAAPDLILVEKVRTFTHGKINVKTIMALHAMVIAIADNFPLIPIKCIDTRMWKKAILGNPSASKQDAVNYINELIGEEVDDDRADAICMALAAERGVKLEDIE